MKKHIALWTLPLISILAMPVMAQHRPHQHKHLDRIAQRTNIQNIRINKGIRNGELTRHEIRVLRKQQRRITRLKYHFLQDGYLDRNERRTLVHNLDKADARIYRLKHNNQYSYRTNRYPAHRYGKHNQSRSSWSAKLDLHGVR